MAQGSAANEDIYAVMRRHFARGVAGAERGDFKMMRDGLTGAINAWEFEYGELPMPRRLLIRMVASGGTAIYT